MNTKFTFAVVGFGHIGRRHATIINQHPGSKLVAIVDSSEQALQHELYPEGVPSFSSQSEMFRAGIARMW
jgi:predicted dehydrogenase